MAENQQHNADWKVEFFSLTAPRQGTAQSTGADSPNGAVAEGSSGPMMRVFKNLRLPTLPEDYSPSSVIAEISTRERPLETCVEIAVAAIVQACVRMNVAMEGFDEPATIALCAPEGVPMPLSFFWSADKRRLFVLPNHEQGVRGQGHDLWFSAYSSYFKKAIFSKLEESQSSNPNILQEMREIYNGLTKFHGSFERAMQSLENHLDISEVRVAVATSRVIFLGKSPLETEGNKLCQNLSAKIMEALKSEELGNRLLKAMVKAIEISTDVEALAAAGVEAEGWEMGENIVNIFKNIVDNHKANPAGAALAMEGARYLAKSSDAAWESMRNDQFRESLVNARQYGKTHDLKEEVNLLLQTLHPDDEAWASR